MKLKKHVLHSIIILFTLWLGVYTSLFIPQTPQPIHAAELKTHVFKFYIDPSLVPDINFAKQVLPKYVADMNYILAKNTSRQLNFDPETGIILTTTTPYSSSATTLPTDGFEVWAHVIPSTQPTYPYSYGGNMSFDSSGAAALGNMHWTRLYDPDLVPSNSDQMRDYWTQIDHMLHEFAHVFSAGMGEYYNLSTITDTTNQTPLLNIDYTNSQDSFWKDKPDFYYDPLFQFAYNNNFIGSPNSRAALLSTVKFANLSATIISGSYRAPTTPPPTVDLSNIAVKIEDTQGNPIPDAQIKIWEIKGISGNESTLLNETTSDATGSANMAWGTTTDPHNNYDFLRLLKVYKTSYTAKANYVSIYDLDIQRLVNNQLTGTITIRLSSTNTSTPKPTASPTPSPTVPPAPDDTLPTVFITSPTNGAIIQANKQTTITATATDPSGIAKVEFKVNDVLVCTDTTSSYSCNWKPNAKNTYYTIQATAYDSTGNSASQSITVKTK